MRICAACGKVTADDKSYCPICGTKLPEPTQPDHTNTIDEINLVNTRLRSVPAKPNNTAKYAIIIGALSLLVIIMIVAVISIAVGSRPKSQLSYNYNKPTEQNNTIINSVGEERYYRPQSDKRFPDIIRFVDNYIYLEFGFHEALYYGKASYTVSGNTITLGSVDLYKFMAGQEIVIIGENPNFPKEHIMDAGARLEYNDTSITIIDFESRWVLMDEYYEYSEEYKDGTVFYLTDDPKKETTETESIIATLNQSANTSTSISYFSETGKQLCFTDRNHSPNPAVIQIYDDHIYIIFPFFEGMYYAKADYTCSGQ